MTRYRISKQNNDWIVFRKLWAWNLMTNTHAVCLNLQSKKI